jgi:predicted HTH domain antitoxin
MPKTVTIEIPDSIVEKYGNSDELERSIFEDIIISEFQKTNLMIRESAKLLGLTYEGFMELLGRQKLPFANATKEELEESYNEFETFMQSRGKT